MKKLLIITQDQFGYHIDSYYHCKYLRSKFNITYICWDHQEKKILLDGIKVVYVSRRGQFLKRIFSFLNKIKKEIGQRDVVIFIKYWRIFTSIIRLSALSGRFVLDIRTSSVTKNSLQRLMEDLLLKFEAKFFSKKIIISEKLAAKLSITDATVIPLGADVISKTNKIFHEMNLLYVGTLLNRNIDQTLCGFAKFYHEYKHKVKIKYTIIGDGPGNEKERLVQFVNDNDLSSAISIEGKIPHTEVKKYFDSHNFGISYVPITSFYDIQPVTKTFEYFLSGMPVVGTETSANRLVINESNGILIRDNSESFYEGLKKIYKIRNRFDSNKIRKSSLNYTWPNIVNKLENILQNC